MKCLEVFVQADLISFFKGTSKRAPRKTETHLGHRRMQPERLVEGRLYDDERAVVVVRPGPTWTEHPFDLVAHRLDVLLVLDEAPEEPAESLSGGIATQTPTARQRSSIGSSEEESRGRTDRR